MQANGLSGKMGSECDDEFECIHLYIYSCSVWIVNHLALLSVSADEWNAIVVFINLCSVKKKSQTWMTASVLKQDPNTQKVEKNAVY